MSPRRVRGREDCLLQKKLSLRGITWEYCWGRTLIHKEDLPFEADLNLIWQVKRLAFGCLRVQTPCCLRFIWMVQV